MTNRRIRYSSILIISLSVVFGSFYSRQSTVAANQEDYLQLWAKNRALMFSLHAEGKKVESLKVAEDNFEFIKQYTNREHPKYMMSLHHVAYINYDLRRYDIAEKQFLETLKMYQDYERYRDSLAPNERKKVGLGFGSGNEQVLLGLIYQATNRPALAEEYLLASIKYYEGRYPEYAWYYKDILFIMADYYSNMGRMAKSREYIKKGKALKAQKKGS